MPVNIGIFADIQRDLLWDRYILGCVVAFIVQLWGAVLWSRDRDVDHWRGALVIGLGALAFLYCGLKWMSQ